MSGVVHVAAVTGVMAWIPGSVGSVFARVLMTAACCVVMLPVLVLAGWLTDQVLRPHDRPTPAQPTEGRLLAVLKRTRGRRQRGTRLIGTPGRVREVNVQIETHRSHGPHPEWRGRQPAVLVPVHLSTELLAEVRRRADADGRPLSAWIVDAVAHELRGSTQRNH